MRSSPFAFMRMHYSVPLLIALSVLFLASVTLADVIFKAFLKLIPTT